jgi:hypothetical protein
MLLTTPTPESAATEELETLLVAFRDAVQLSVYPVAQSVLDCYARKLASHWPVLGLESRKRVQRDTLAVVAWANLAVKTGRAQMRQHLERIESSNVYRMPDPAARSTWDVKG